MKRSNFRHFSLNQASRKTFGVSAFGGVDYSTQRFLVNNARAIDILNYVYRDGVVQKRRGIEELFRVKNFIYQIITFDGEKTSEVVSNTTNFNGIWKFVAEDNKEHIIAHIGKLLYEVKNIGNDQISIDPIIIAAQDSIITYPYCYQFEDFKSSAFVGGNKLWFLGGNKYVCVRFLSDGNLRITPVENSNLAPIPTTTIAITYANSIVGSNRSSLDKVNLLTMWRKNLLLSGTTKDEDEKTKTEFFEYTLDAPLIYKDETKDMANFTITIEERGVIVNE